MFYRRFNWVWKFLILFTSFMVIISILNGNTHTVLYNKSNGVILYHDIEYKYLINNPEKCSHKAPFLTILIKSLPSYFEQRQAIRESWGNISAWNLPHNMHVVVLFMLGVEGTSENNELQSMLVDENSVTKDLIQENFVENFYNLTVKVISQLKWINDYCYNTRYFMTSDIDVFINIKNLVLHLQEQKVESEKAFFGCVHWMSMPKRNPKSKYFVPTSIYPGFFYPNYCPGAGYVLSKDAVNLLYSLVPSIPMLYIDDVYVGLLADLGGMQPIHSSKFSCERKITSISCILDYYITSHGYTSAELKDTFIQLQREPQRKCVGTFWF